jgi:hypothetical protein
MPDNSKKDEGGNISVLEILSLLESYEKIHVQGDDAWKKALWNLYKGRHLRKRNNLSYVSETYCSAADVREDLTPRITLRPNNDDGTFSCMEDGVAIVTATDEHKNGPGEEDLIAIVSSASSAEEEDNLPALSDENTAEDGLRKRRGAATANKETGKEWTVEHNSNNNDDENKGAQQAENQTIDPLELLAGAFPPRELKEAQKRAKQALQCYIEAANLLIRLRAEGEQI